MKALYIFCSTFILTTVAVEAKKKTIVTNTNTVNAPKPDRVVAGVPIFVAPPVTNTVEVKKEGYIFRTIVPTESAEALQRQADDAFPVREVHYIVQRPVPTHPLEWQSPSRDPDFPKDRPYSKEEYEAVGRASQVPEYGTSYDYGPGGYTFGYPRYYGYSYYDYDPYYRPFRYHAHFGGYVDSGYGYHYPVRHEREVCYEPRTYVSRPPPIAPRSEVASRPPPLSPVTTVPSRPPPQAPVSRPPPAAPVSRPPPQAPRR